MKIEGTVMVRRKNLWVTRFASINDAVFTYKKDRNDTKARYLLDLRKADIKKGVRSNGDRFIEIIDKSKKDETVKVAFDNMETFTKWGLVLLESTKPDEVLRKVQIIEPSKKQEELKRQQDEEAEKKAE